MSCLTTSATRRSRSVPAAVLIASAAASSHEVLLVPMISVTLYTLMTLSFDHVRPAPGLTKPPCPVVEVAASVEFGLAGLTGAWCAGTPPRRTKGNVQSMTSQARSRTGAMADRPGGSRPGPDAVVAVNGECARHSYRER